MGYSTFPKMTERFSVAYSGAATEAALTLNRPSVAGASGRWSIQEVKIYAPTVGASGFAQIFRKASASGATEQDVTNAASVGVLMGEVYLESGDWTKLIGNEDNSDMSDVGLRVRLNLNAVAQTVLINVTYHYDTSN